MNIDSEIIRFIKQHWTDIWGYGRDCTDGESSMYVALPISVIEREYGMNIDEIRSE